MWQARKRHTSSSDFETFTFGKGKFILFLLRDAYSYFNVHKLLIHWPVATLLVLVFTSVVQYWYRLTFVTCERGKPTY